MKVVVIGRGGREDAIADLYSRSGSAVVSVPGNAGMELRGRCESGEATSIVTREAADVAAIGSETDLCRGLANELRARGCSVIGPGRDGAMIECSKIFGKKIAVAAGVPVADSPSSDSDFPYYFKYDGLAAGKGTFLIAGESDYRLARDFASGEGRSGRYSLEKPLEGIEFSSFLFCRGGKARLIGHAMDHKRLSPDSSSPMTGGMASISPHPRIAESYLDEIACDWGERTLVALKKQEIDYEGFLYLGGIKTEAGVFLLEYNCRLGDPEAQALLPRFVLDDPLNMMSLRKVSTAPHAALVIATEGYPFRKDSMKLQRDLIDNLASAVTLYFGTGSERRPDHYWFEGGRILTAVARSAACVKRIREFCSDIDGVVCRFDVLYPSGTAV